MEAFTTHTGLVATIDRANIDTDAIIPKQFLKSIRRTGFEDGLFFDWRFLPDGKTNPDFVLNRPEKKGATILIARNNFGCGSSREHAVWALAQFGFKVVIAPRQNGIPAFADIFHNNSVKNGLLNVELTEEEIQKIFDLAAQNPSLKATVDLVGQKVTLHSSPETVIPFQIDKAEKDYLIQGLDDIGMTLQSDADIAAFEKRHNAQMLHL